LGFQRDIENGILCLISLVTQNLFYGCAKRLRGSGRRHTVRTDLNGGEGAENVGRENAGPENEGPSKNVKDLINCR